MRRKVKTAATPDRQRMRQLKALAVRARDLARECHNTIEQWGMATAEEDLLRGLAPKLARIADTLEDGETAISLGLTEGMATWAATRRRLPPF